MEDESGNKKVVPVLFTSCAASPKSIMRYREALESALNEGKIDSIEDEYGYYWADLKIDDEEPIKPEYYSVVGLFFYNISEQKPNNDELYLTKYASKTSGDKIDSSVEENVSSKWYWNFYDTTNKDIIRRKKIGDIQYEQVAANFSPLDGQRGVDENVEYAKKIQKYLALPADRKIDVSSSAIMPFNAKFLIDKDAEKIICKYYLEGGYDAFLKRLSGKQVCWSTILSIKMLNGKPQSESHLVWTSYQLFKDIYGTNDGIWSWGNGTKGIGGIGLSGANDFDNILYNDERNKIILTVNYYIKKNGNYEKYTNDIENNEEVKYQYGGSYAEYAEVPKERLGIVSGYRLVSYNNGTQKSLGIVTNNCPAIYDNGTKYSYKFARFGYDDNSIIAAEDNLSQKIKANVVNFCGGAEHLVVNFYYDPAEEPPKYKIKYVDESGNEIATSSSEMEIPKSGKTVEKINIDGYIYKGVLTSNVNKGSLDKASVNVKNVKDTSASKYISYGKQDVLVVFVYRKQPKLFYSYIEVELDADGKYKYSKTLLGPNEKNNNGENIEVPIKNISKHYPVGYAVENGGIDKGYNDLFKTGNIVNDLKTLPNKIIFKGADHTDKNYLIVIAYLKYKPITYNLFVYRRAIDENNKIQNENLKIGINPEGNKVTASIGTVESNVDKECRKYTITLEDDRKKTKVNLKNILESDMSEDQIIEYKFAGKWSNIKQSDTSKLKDYDSNNGINYHLNKTLTSRNFYLWLYYNEDKPKTVTICPILSFEAANSAFKTTPHTECDDSDGKYNSECDPSKIETIYIPAGEDVTTKIANAPKIMFLNYNDADSYGRRGGIWQKLEKSWVEIDNDILNQYKKAAGIENSKNFGAKELYQKYKDKINSITKDKIVKKENGKYYVMKYKYTIIGHSLLYMDKIYVDSSNNNISSENQVNESTKIKETSVYKKMEEYYAKTSYAVLSQKNNIFGYDKIHTNEVISKLNKMEDNLYTKNITIPDNTPNGVNIASARINYVTSRSGSTVFNKNSSISKYLWVDGDSGSNTIIGVPINKKISELYGNTNTSKAGINVLVPAHISISVNATEQVNHSDDNNISGEIQNHSKLKVTTNIESPTGVYTYMPKDIENLSDELKEKIKSYITNCVYIFDFNVQRLDENGNPTGDPTKIIKSDSKEISVYVNDDSVENNKNGSAVKDYVNNITVLAFTKNTPDDYIENSIQIAMKTTTNEKWKKITYSNEIYSIQDCRNKTTNNIWSKTLVDRNEEISQDAYYVVKASKTIASIGRIYDFRITDCTDVDFKSVFRKSGQGQGVNSLTGTVYFSGIKELQIFGNGVNSLEMRKDPNTLPLGPYKHTNSNYVDAPKMGYRISFDVKTTGKYVTTKDDANKLSNNYKKYVKITPSYYYIKKDGSGYNDKITLYYKNSSNKYVKFIGSGFKISYKPNDGYRNVTNLGITNITDMFTDKYVTLEVSDEDGFTLNIDSMCTNYYGYVQSWYGEFKLPNTTIAVKNEEGDVNKPLTDGYLGVKFDISCFYEYTNNNEAKTTKKVSYNTLDKNASGTNTTQWDYEGYLGFKNAGKDVTGNDGLYLQFPKGKLLVSSQTDYEQIRGTVVFFDLDNRASNDFE